MAGIMTLEGFPSPPGDKYHTVADIAGPKSYTTVTTGSPPTGGQAVSLAQLGLPVSVIYAETTGSDDGQYDAIVLMSPFNTAPPQGSGTGIILKWVNAATGAEVTGSTDLSARTIRVYAVGR